MNKIIVSNIKGGFGNQLFQYATGLAVAKRNNAEFKVELDFFKIDKFKDAFRLDSLNTNYKVAQDSEYLDLKSIEGVPPYFYKILNKLKIPNKYNKRTHITDTISFKPSKRILMAKAPSYIEGWCVKKEYFSTIRKNLIEIYTPKNPFSDSANKILHKINCCNSVSIHIRHGDYIGNNTFELLPLEFYIKAIDEIYTKIENPTFFCFSDDIQWAKENLNKVSEINFIDLKSDRNYSGIADVEEFFLMKACKHNIIANSSFSWWPAYLNENTNKIVIAPRKWYKDPFYQNSIEKNSFHPQEWILL